MGISLEFKLLSCGEISLSFSIGKFLFSFKRFSQIIERVPLTFLLGFAYFFFVSLLDPLQYL
ncbi:hypothetical protein LEP1GSC055_3798 [Leptospira borgpetersenii str. Brem 307]|nr:hypothetical protein LEP1GSC055_3798 [Leptospira borgpetersenii str. Brem 307]